MKVVFTLVLLLVLTQVFSQRKISYGFSQISPSQVDSCKKLSPQLALPFRPVDSLTLPLDGSERKFQVLRSESLSGFSILEDSIGLLIINDSTGIAENVIGKPHFNYNSRRFAAFGQSKIYRRQMLQVGEINDGVIEANLYLRPKENIVIKELICICDGAIYLKDTNGSFWICNFKVE